MRSQNIFNTDIVSGHTIYADIVQSTGGKVYNNSNLEIKENLYVGENALISGTIHVDQDAVLKSKLYVEDDLNVGENTQLSGTIHVDQDAVLKSKLYVEDDLNVGENTQLSGTIHVDQDAVLKSKLYVEDDLNVGENTQLSGTIHVDQDAVLKSKLYVEDDLNVGENTQLSGTIHVDQDAVLKSKLYVEDDLNVGENTQLSGTIHVDQDAVFRSGLFVEGNAQINGNLYVSGDRVIMETSTVRVEDKNIELAVLDSATDATADQGGITLKGTTDKTILWSNATDSWDLSENLGIADGKYIFSDKLRARDSAGLSLEDDGGNGIFIEDGGNIGINTTSPSDKLDINGNLSLSNNSKIRWKDSLGNPKDTLRVDDKDELLISNNTTGNGGNIIFRSKAGFGESMTIDADGNVGIGTTSPDYPLDVIGTLRVSEAQTWLRSNSNNSATLYVNQEGTNASAVFMGGNVGIGTASPNFKNSIVAGPEDTSPIALALSLDDSSLVVGQEVSLGYGQADIVFSKISSYYESNGGLGLKFYTGNKTGATGIDRTKVDPSLTITSDGNVGIGTTSPIYSLDVHNSSNLDTGQGLRIRTRFEGTGSNALLVKNEGGSGDNYFVVRNDGNVGIGTTSPNEKLDLNGILYLRNSTVPSTTTNRLYASGGNLFWNGQNVLDNVDTWRAISSTPADGATTTSISSDWAFDNVKTAVPANAVFTDTNTWRAISSTPADGATTTSISSDWAFDNVKTAVPANAVFTDTVPTFSYNSTTKTLTITT